MIQFDGCDLYLGNRAVTLDYPIKEVQLFGNLVVVLFRPESFKGSGQFQNLVAYSIDGQMKWVAELPTNLSMDAYYQILSADGLLADSYCSYRCKIDLSNGKIISKEFYK